MKPRYRGIYETDEHYVKYLEKYYSINFPNRGTFNDGIYALKKEDIIQDLPINSKEKSVFDTIGMTDDEIKISQEVIGPHKR